MSRARENTYQADLKKRLSELIPGCFIMKMPADDVQGLPDLLVLFRDKWAVLEVKRSQYEPFRPNQEYYLDMFGEMSFSAVIYPENEKEVLHELQFAFRIGRPTCVSQS